MFRFRKRPTAHTADVPVDPYRQGAVDALRRLADEWNTERPYTASLLRDRADAIERGEVTNT